MPPRKPIGERPAADEPRKRAGRQVQAQEAVEKPAKQAKQTKAAKKPLPQLSSAAEVAQIVATVQSRLTGKSTRLYGIDSTYSSLKSSLTCALQDNRGNSTIVIGAHASGKTTLVRQVLNEVGQNESVNVSVIELPGRVYEETQTALKHLLSQMRALLGIGSKSDLDEAELSEFVAYDQLTAMIRQFLTTFPPKAKRRYMVLVLEDIDRFASNSQQNLLYSLFELTLALPVYVVGTACRIDVLEMLEKRVKSRFSQNIVYVPMSESEDGFCSRIKRNLIVEGFDGYNSAVSQMLMASDAMTSLCKRIFSLSKDVRPIFRTLSVAYSQVDATQTGSFNWNQLPYLVEEAILLEGNPSAAAGVSIHSTSLVELLLLVALVRLASKYPANSAFTFDLIHEEMRATKQRAPSLEHFVWSRTAVQVAYERLLATRLLLPASSANAGASTGAVDVDRSYRTVRLGMPNFMLTDLVSGHPAANKELAVLAAERF